MQLLQELVFNFFTWWYLEQFIVLIQLERTYLRNLAHFTGLTIHTRYLFTPFYKDFSLIGRVFAFVVRSFIILFGLVSEFILLLLLIGLDIGYLILPLSPILKLWQQLLHN